MGIDDSYASMLDQLAKVHISTDTDFISMRNALGPTLLVEAAERKSLAEMFARFDLSSAKESQRLMLEASLKLEMESRHANALTAALLENLSRDGLVLGQGPLQSAWGAAFRESRLLENDLARQAAVALRVHDREETFLESAVLKTAARWERELAESHKLMAEVTSRWDTTWRESLRSLGQIENFAVAVPRLAAERWSAELVSDRISLIENSFRNVSALQLLEGSAIAGGLAAFSTEPLSAAGQFVFDNVDLLRRMPPTLPFDYQEEAETVQPHRNNEELGAKLDPLLGAVDGRLLDLRLQSWQRLSEGAAGARLAMLGLRELFSDLLRLLAPDQEIILSAAWKTRPGGLPPNPTRAERIVFLMGRDAPELRALLQFEASVESSHKFAHTFADDPEMVRVHMAQLEIWIYLILLYSQKRK